MVRACVIDQEFHRPRRRRHAEREGPAALELKNPYSTSSTARWWPGGILACLDRYAGDFASYFDSSQARSPAPAEELEHKATRPAAWWTSQNLGDGVNPGD